MVLFIILLPVLVGLIIWSKKLSDRDNYNCYFTISGARVVAVVMLCDIVYMIYKHVNITFS